MAKSISAELSDEQFEKYEILKDNGMDVGEAIDLIFKFREELKIQNNAYFEDRVAELNEKKKSLEEEMSIVENELGILDKISDVNLDFKQKQEILEKEYAAVDETYDIQVQRAKTRISWAKMFFDF